MSRINDTTSRDNLVAMLEAMYGNIRRHIERGDPVTITADRGVEPTPVVDGWAGNRLNDSWTFRVEINGGARG